MAAFEFDGSHWRSRDAWFSFQVGSQNAVIVSFIADEEAAPRVVPLDEIASIV